MAGKDYAKAKGTRAHKITIQAMWQMLLQQVMNYLQEHDDDLRRHLLSLAHFDTTTKNDELVTLLTMGTFREHIYQHFGIEQRQKSKLSVLVAVHADGGCAPAVHQSSEIWHVRVAFVFV